MKRDEQIQKNVDNKSFIVLNNKVTEEETRN